MKHLEFTISILNYNRKEVICELLESLKNISERSDCEIIIVDNGSTDGSARAIEELFPQENLICLPRNIGVDGRNIAIANARGKYIITLDDDIIGIGQKHLEVLKKIFSSSNDIAAVCFKVKDYYTGDVCNWCHPYAKEKFADNELETTEISEGAVAFRRSIFDQTGYYPHNYFISHEGADLAARILNSKLRILYSPKISVKHKYAKSGRKNWRRYYYDTRNRFWLVARNYRLVYASLILLRGTSIMLVYSLRDGFFFYWLKAVLDGIVGLPKAFATRSAVSKEVEQKIKIIHSNKPGILYYLKKRLKQRRVRI